MMKILSSKLYDLELDKLKSKEDEINVNERILDGGTKLDHAILHPYRMIKDHRTNDEIGNVDAFLDGDIGNLVENLLSKLK